MVRPLLCILICSLVFPAALASSSFAQDESKTAKQEAKQEAAEVKEKEADTPPQETTDSKTESEPEESQVTAEEAENKISLESKYLLPPSTKAWVSIPDVDELEKRFNETQYGKLANDKAIQPFVESLKQQGREWLEKRNVRLGIQVEDLHKIQSGEICLAGVLQELEGGQPARGSHGLVLLVDVGETEDAAWELFEKVNEDLAKNRETTLEKFEINGVQVNKTTIKNPRRARFSQVSFQTVCSGWLLAADNEEIFRDILRRLASPAEIQKEATFGSQPQFLAIMEQANLGEHESQIDWYIDPFGYIQLAQAISDEEAEVRQQRDNWAKILQQQGFDVIRGVGGSIGLATDQHELLHKAYIYAPREKLTKNQKRVFELFDFSSSKNGMPYPADWVPADVAGYFAGNWDFEKLLNNVGFVYDAFLEEGDFERMINDFKVDPDMQLDIPKLVGMLDNQVTIISTTEQPIDESSERVCIGLRINGDPEFVFQSVKRAVGRGNGEQIILGGHKVIEVDTTKEPEIDLGDEFEGLDLGDDVSDEGKNEEEERFNLFDKRYFVVAKGYLLVANEKNFLKKLLMSKPKIKLNETEDYIQIHDALEELTNQEKVSFRQFGRIDRALETNYEMIRRGKMGQSQTVLAKVLNKIFEDDDDKNVDAKKEREQKLDGSKLPEDYAETVAPYLGPTGWVMETENDGWRITGCLLKKKAISEVVKKDAEKVTEAKSSQR